jgi:hypothetical protein
MRCRSERGWAPWWFAWMSITFSKLTSEYVFISFTTTIMITEACTFGLSQYHRKSTAFRVLPANQPNRVHLRVLRYLFFPFFQLNNIPICMHESAVQESRVGTETPYDKVTGELFCVVISSVINSWRVALGKRSNSPSSNSKPSVI